MERIFTCNLCEALCGLRVEVDGERVTSIRGNDQDLLSRGHICPKAIGLRELLDDPDRLRAPVRRGSDGRFARVSWDDAMGDIATRLRAIRAKHGRDAVALYVGNPVVHNHRSALAAQFLTAALGSTQRFDPNSQDSNPRLFACMHVYGDALSIPVPDVDRTDFLMILGANPAASGGSHMGLGDVRARMSAIRERGGRVVLIDPRRSETADWSTEHHFIRPGGDAALLLAMIHTLFAEGLVHEARARHIAVGVDDLRVIAASYPPARVAAAIGIDAETIKALARDLAAARRACVYARVGVCQSEFGPVTSWLVEAINVITDHFDRAGCAMFPLAAADIAPLGRRFIGNHWGRWRSRVRGLPEFLGALPSAAMAEEMETPGKGQIRALVCLAGNPVRSTPNSERIDRAIAGLELVVSIDQYVNETARHAHYVLPPRHVFETGNFDVLLQRFAVRNVVKYSPPILRTDDDTRDDWEIATDLAARVVGPDSRLARRAWRAMTRDLPERIVDVLLRTGSQRLSLAKLRDAPHGIDLGPLTPQRRERVRTADGMVQLAPTAITSDLPRLEKWIDQDQRAPLVLIGRRNLRSNNSWLHNLPTLAKGPDRAHLLMHPDDAARRGLVTGARVRVSSRVGAITAVLEVSDEVMPGVASLPHGFGHGVVRETLRVAGQLAGPDANALTDELLVEPIIGTSVLNGVPIEVTGA